MTQKQYSQLQMLLCIKSNFYKHNKEFCDGIPAVKIVLKQIFLRIDKLKEFEVKGGRGKAFRDVKIQLRQNLCETALLVSSGLLAYANLTKNKALKNSVNYSYSDFFRSVETEMLNRCKLVLRTAQRTKGLSLVGFDDKLSEELKQQILQYEKLSAEKIDSKKETMKYNYIISKLIDECILLLKDKLTPLMKMLSKKYSNKCKYYFDSIAVKKQPGRKKKRNKKQKENSKIKVVQSNILHQKSSEEIMHRFAELAAAE